MTNNSKKYRTSCLSAFARPWRSKYRFMLICDIALILLEKPLVLYAMAIIEENLSIKRKVEVDQIISLLQNKQEIEKKYLPASALINQYRANRDFFLKEERKENTYAVVGYHVNNTLTENGSVKRGVCKVKNNELEKLVESSIQKIDGIIKATPLDGSMPFTISQDTYVSMNMLGFNPTIFSYIEEHFPKFLNDNQDNILKCEYLIPDVLSMATNENYAKTLVIPTTAKWEGVTYKEDKEQVVKAIEKLISEGVYSQNLWKK